MLLFFAAQLSLSCATTAAGRSQVKLFSDQQMNQMGSQSFAKLKAHAQISDDRALQAGVDCVVAALVAVVKDDTGVKQWTATVFKDKSPNAFALPGGYIGIHEGLKGVARNADQLATVVGHEIGHVLARHANERASQIVLAEAGMKVADIFIESETQRGRLLLAALGLTAQFGVLMPYSRRQETEADSLGLEYMARAGFDPAQSLEFWQNMLAASANGPPEFLSTHPAPRRRLNDLKRQIPKAEQLYAEALSQGRKPDCSWPGSD